MSLASVTSGGQVPLNADRPLFGLTIGRRSLSGLMGLVLLCLLMAMASGAAFANEHDMPAVSGSEAPAEPEDDQEEDDTGDDSSDGSEALTGNGGAVVPPDLHPIGLDEEEALLGDWGDSADEDED